MCHQFVEVFYLDDLYVVGHVSLALLLHPEKPPTIALVKNPPLHQGTADGGSGDQCRHQPQPTHEQAMPDGWLCGQTVVCPVCRKGFAANEPTNQT
jgi:hypothetical protein